MDLRLGKVGAESALGMLEIIDIDRLQMLVLGTVFRCLGPILTIAACLSCKPLFLNPMDKREEASQYACNVFCVAHTSTELRFT